MAFLFFYADQFEAYALVLDMSRKAGLLELTTSSEMKLVRLICVFVTSSSLRNEGVSRSCGWRSRNFLGDSGSEPGMTI